MVDHSAKKMCTGSSLLFVFSMTREKGGSDFLSRMVVYTEGGVVIGSRYNEERLRGGGGGGGGKGNMASERKLGK